MRRDVRGRGAVGEGGVGGVRWEVGIYREGMGAFIRQGWHGHGCDCKHRLRSGARSSVLAFWRLSVRCIYPPLSSFPLLLVFTQW